MSHSAWSAWIEINDYWHVTAEDGVALRLECVDRNICKFIYIKKTFCRTPLGVRG